MKTVIHVTHEATHKIGGIGAVLHGLLTSETYGAAVARNVLVGTCWPGHVPAGERLGSGGEVLYSGLDGLSLTPLGTLFATIEREFSVRIVYGRKLFRHEATGAVVTPEILLIDVTRSDLQRVGEFKFQLWDRFGVDSHRHEHIWDFEQYVRLGPPAIAALRALGVFAPENGPAMILAHEYMGMPTALAGLLEQSRHGTEIRALFHAHEVATVRRIVEHHPGHDTMFYNVMRQALPVGRHLTDVFGDQSDYYKHGLVRAARFCDGVLGVGDEVLQELRFLDPEFARSDLGLAYNGVPCWRIDGHEKSRSRRLLQSYCKNLLGEEPQFLFTHVTRLVQSKGLWRDLTVLARLEPLLRARGETAVLLVISTELPSRNPEDIYRMEREYGWPVVHREGLPDLSTGEANFYQLVQGFNARSRNIKVIFINQFGFDRATCGMRVPADIQFMDVRKGTDVEFGQSIYEPFGIAQVEPISFGGICVYSSICGCAGFVRRASENRVLPNVLIADYTDLSGQHWRIDQLMRLDAPQRQAIEHEVAGRIALELVERLPRSPADFERLIDSGFELASRMSWDVVARDYILPGLERAATSRRLIRAG
jgi:hypothetical protein